MVLPKTSLAVTVTVKAAPAVALVGALTLNEDRGDGLTAMGLLTPVTAPAEAVSVTLPALLRTTETVAAPLVHVIGEVLTFSPSLLVSVKVPLQLLPKASFAVTVTLKAVPAVALLGALRPITATAPGVT